MPNFAVRLVRLDNPEESVVRMIDATSAGGALDIGNNDGWRAVSAKVSADGADGMDDSREMKPALPKVLKDEVLEPFASVCGFMLGAGLPLSQALRFYADGLTGRAERGFRGSIYAMIERLRAGEGAEAAFSRVGVFPAAFVGLIGAGDKSDLGRAFEAIARFIRRRIETRKKIASAIMKPLIVLVFLSVVFVASQCVMVPMAEETLLEFGLQPRGINQVFFGVSRVVRATWPFVCVAVIGVGGVLARSAALRERLMEGAMKRWKGLREAVMSVRQLAVFSTFEMLYSNGMEARRCLPICAGAVADTRMEAELLAAAEDVSEDRMPIPAAFREHTSCDPVAVHMLEIGVSSAILDQQLRYLAEMYEKRAEYSIDRVVGVVSNVTLVIAFLAVILTFLGSYFPILSSLPQLMQDL